MATGVCKSSLTFTILSECNVSMARSAEMKLRHGSVKTPVFMPVGTQGTLKGLLPEQLKALGYEIILANTYHLGIRPGPELLRKAGGLHEFMGWDRSILTDSGGFQMVSLLQLADISEQGVKFVSPYDGSECMLTPERSIHIQNAIGADIIMQLDDVIKTTTSDGNRIEEATHSEGTRPLQLWREENVTIGTKKGTLKRLKDKHLQCLVLELKSKNISALSITCPPSPASNLGIKLPFIVILAKNLNKYFSFEIQIMDNTKTVRRFRANNYQSTTRVKSNICTLPLRLEMGWNRIVFNMMDFTKRAYGTEYVETMRVQIHANCRLRRIYFAERNHTEDDVPAEFKLFIPVQENLSHV